MRGPGGREMTEECVEVHGRRNARRNLRLDFRYFVIFSARLANLMSFSLEKVEQRVYQFGGWILKGSRWTRNDTRILFLEKEKFETLILVAGASSFHFLIRFQTPLLKQLLISSFPFALKNGTTFSFWLPASGCPANVKIKTKKPSKVENQRI